MKFKQLEGEALIEANVSSYDTQMGLDVKNETLGTLNNMHNVICPTIQSIRNNDGEPMIAMTSKIYDFYFLNISNRC
jgi:hypothetical protein